jgi:protein-tyrosine-phosphatase
VADAKISSVLFVCGRNAVRSPMARTLTESLFPAKFFTASAGVTAGERDPFVDAVLAEIGLSLGNHRPRSFEELEDLNFDLAVTLSPEAHHRMLELTRTSAIAVEYWPTLDPTLATGSREQILSAYRGVRDRLAARIRHRLENPSIAEFTASTG